MDQNSKLPIKDDPSIKEVIQSVKKVFSFLLSKWLVILIVTVVGGVFGVLYSKSSPKKYEAVCSFVIDSKDKGAAGLGLSALGLNVGGSSGGLFGDVENIKWLYTSDLMISQVLLSNANRENGTTSKLISWYIEQEDLQKQFQKDPLIRNVTFGKDVKMENLTRAQSSVLKICTGKILKESLKVSNGGRRTESIIVTNVLCRDEAFAKAFSDAWVRNVNAYFILTKTEKAKHEIEVLQGKTDSVRMEMNRSITRVAASVDDVPFANPNRQINSVPTAKAKIDITVSNAVYEELVKNLEISKLSLLKQTPIIQIIDEPRLPLTAKAVTTMKGLLSGAILAAFVIISFLIALNLYRNIMR